MLQVMIGVVFGLVKPTSPPINFISEHTGMIWGFINISVIVQNLLWCHLGGGITQFLLMIVLSSVFLLAMVEVVLVLSSPTFPPRKLIVGLIMVILKRIKRILIREEEDLRVSGFSLKPW